MLSAGLPYKSVSAGALIGLVLVLLAVTILPAMAAASGSAETSGPETTEPFIEDFETGPETGKAPIEDFEGDPEAVDASIEDFEDDPETDDAVVKDFEDETDAGDGPQDIENSSPPSEASQAPCNPLQRDRRTICLHLPFDVNGNLRLAAAYNFAHSAPRADATDWRGFSKLKPEINLEISDTVSSRFRYFLNGTAAYDAIYRVRGKDEFTDAVIDEYEAEAELGQAYIQVKLHDALDLKAGRQIVVWGRSDMIRVVDVLNPLNLREPGLTDIEDLRMPLCMTRLDAFWKQWRFSSILIHEIRFDKLPAWGSDFYPAESPLPYEITPDSSIDNTEFAFSLSKTFQGLDFALYFAHVYNDNFHVETVTDDTPPRYDPHLEHSRIKLFGGDLNLALGNWLLKSEVAYVRDIAYYQPGQAFGSQVVRGPRRLYDQLDSLVGFEYMGFDDTMISMDAVMRHIRDYDALLESFRWGPDRTETQWAARVSRTFWHETLTLELLVSLYEWDGEGGAFERFTIEYDVTDAVKTRTGMVLYQAGDQTGFEQIGDNDRLFFDVEYSF